MAEASGILFELNLAFCLYESPHLKKSTFYNTI